MSRSIPLLTVLLLSLSYCKKSDGAGAGGSSGAGMGGASAYQTSAQIGAAGGTISDPNGAWTLTIPAGALSQTKTITITTNATATGAIPADYANTTGTLSFEPHGLTFLSPATLKVKYLQGDMTEGGIEEKMQKQYYINDDSKVTAMASTVNMASNEITASVQHFSFSASLTSSISRVNSGATRRASSVRRVANRVIAYFNSLANDAARSAEFQANATLLNAFVLKLVQILGSDILTAAFPNADFDGDGTVNSADPIVPVTGANITLTSSGSLFVSTNAGAISSTQFVWRSSATGTYSIRLNGTNCSDGTQVASGAVTQNLDNTYTPINASALVTGDNEYRICVTTTPGPVTKFLLVVIARDEVAPVSSATPAGGTYATAQNVAMSCLDTGEADCAQIAYTTNGTDPTFDAAGNVTNGTLVTGMWAVPFGGPTSLKIVSRDDAGNVGSVVNYSFTGPLQTPPTTYASPNGGAFITGQTITLNCQDIIASGCKRIVYTVDGTIPKFSPANGTIVNAATTSLSVGTGSTIVRFRSENNAGFVEPFRELVFSVSSTGFTYAATGRGLARGIGSNPTSFVDIAVGKPRDMHRDPSTGILYATADDGFYISTDLGNTWTRRTIANGLGSDNTTRAYTVGATVYVGTSGGLSISIDGGDTFVNKTTADGLGDNTVQSVRAVGSNVYAGTNGGFSVSNNNGATFTNKTTANGLGGNFVGPIALSGSSIYISTGGGLSISTDGGNSFVNRTTVNGLFNNSIAGVAAAGSTIFVVSGYWLSISTDNGLTFTSKSGVDGLPNNQLMSVSANGPFVCVSSQSGLALSLDSGVTFVNKTPAEGLGSNFVFNAIRAGSTIYAATNLNLSISTDGGATFINQYGTNGLGSVLLKFYISGTTIYGGFATSTDGGANFSRNTSGALIGGTRDVLVSGSNIYVATGSGLAISTDGGATYSSRTVANGLANNNLLSVYASSGRVYAGTTCGGLSVSADNGATFSTVTTTNGLGGNCPQGIFANGLTVFAATDGGLSKSTDGGLTFVNRTTANGLGSNNAYAVSSVSSNVYVATQSGLAVSTDNGLTFTNKTTTNGLGDNFVNGVYAYGTTIYVGTNGGLGISTDGGATFANRTTVNGLGHNQVYGVFFAP